MSKTLELKMTEDVKAARKTVQNLVENLDIGAEERRIIRNAFKKQYGESLYKPEALEEGTKQISFVITIHDKGIVDAERLRKLLADEGIMAEVEKTERVR